MGPNQSVISTPAGDNAAMESFFALLQNNVLDRRRWATRQDLRLAIITWIERTYHRRRRQPRLGRLTPVEYETIMTTPAIPSRLTQPVTKTCSSPDGGAAWCGSPRARLQPRPAQPREPT